MTDAPQHQAPAGPPMDFAAALSACMTYFHARRDRLRHNLSRQQAAVLRAVPWLLHFNAAGLPGCRDGQSVPAGIARIAPDEVVDALWPELFGRPKPVEEPLSLDIEMVAMSGDAGTFGQNDETTFHYWVVVEGRISDSGMSMLRQKCDQIAAWLSKVFRLDTAFTVLTAEEFRGNFFQLDAERQDDSRAMPAWRDRLLASFFTLAGKLPLFYLYPAPCPGGYETMRELWKAGQWSNPQATTDLGDAGVIDERTIVHDVLHTLTGMAERPSEVVLPLAMSLVQLRRPEGSGVADIVKSAMLDQPECTDPFELQFDLIEAGLADVDPLSRFYLRELYYLRSGAVLSRQSGREPPSDSHAARVAARIKTWAWSPLVVMSLDNVTLWNYRQLAGFHQTMQRFFAFAQGELERAMAGLTRETGSAVSLLRRAGEVGVHFRALPAKVQPVLPYTTRYYAGARYIFRRVASPRRGRSKWETVMIAPSGRGRDAATTEIVLRDGKTLLPQLLWLFKAGMIPANAQVTMATGDKEAPAAWVREYVASCQALCRAHLTVDKPLARERKGRRQPLAFVIAAGVADEATPVSSDGATKVVSRHSTTRVLSEAAVFDYEGTGEAALDDFTLAYATGTGEVFAHHYRFAHHALARAFALILPHLRYDDEKKKLNVDLIVPPNPRGMNVRMALQLSLFEMHKFFSGDTSHIRRYVTRHRGVCYIFERAPDAGTIALRICRTVPHLLQSLESTGGAQTKVQIDRQVMGLERLRDLYTHAQSGKLNLYLFRETDPWQLHLIDETGAFYSDRISLNTAPGVLGDTMTFLTRYAERKGVAFDLHDVTRRQGRMTDYIVAGARDTTDFLAKRSSTFVLGISGGGNDGRGPLRVELGSGSSSASGAMMQVQLSAELIEKLSAAARKAKGVSLIELPPVLALGAGQEIHLRNGAAALRAARSFRAMLLGSA